MGARSRRQAGLLRSSTRAPTANTSALRRAADCAASAISTARGGLEWQTAFTDSTEFSPKSIEELGTLWRERVVPGDTVVAYCYIGYRASGTYFISRLLGYPVKLYDGSYDEWAKLNYPTVTTVTPLRQP